MPAPLLRRLSRGAHVPGTVAPSEQASAPDAPSVLPQVTARGVQAALALVAGLALLGIPLGLLWTRLAPGATVQVRGGRPVSVMVGEALIGSDATLLLVTAVPALLVGSVAGVRGTRDGPFLPAALAVGAALLAAVAWQAGGVVTRAADTEELRQAADNAFVDLAVQLQATGVLLVPAMVAVLGYLVSALLAERPLPAADREPTAREISSGRTAPGAARGQERRRAGPAGPSPDAAAGPPGAAAT